MTAFGGTSDATTLAEAAPAAVTLSVVVPARDEGPNIDRLVREVAAALDPCGIAWELIVVDDGSVDDTAARLAVAASHDPRVRAIGLATSHGQTAALLVGLRAARGAYLATLDGDLQCSPAEIPALLHALDGADVACGVRTRRHDPPARRLASALANSARRAVLAPAVRDLACPVRVFRRSAFEDVVRTTPLFDGAHRWLPALFELAGQRVVQRPVAHHERTAGTSKYTNRGRIRPIAREIGVVGRLALARSPRVRTLAVAAMLALVAAPLLAGLGAWPLIEPDEGRNAEVAREMLAHAWWAVPHFNGLAYLDKPVLLFWMVAGCFRLLGVNELAARLPSALAAVATMALTFELGRVLIGWRRGLLAAVVLATTPIVLAYGRLVIFDLPLTVFTTLALYGLVRARLGGGPAGVRFDGVWFAVVGIAIGLAVLVKGPVGIAVPLLLWFAGRGAFVERRRGGAGPLVAVATAALVVVPWLVAVERNEPGILHYAIVEETLLRLTSSEQFNRAAPVYFYGETLAWALGAWGIVLVALAPVLVRLRRARKPDGDVVAFATRGALALVVFFTLSASKRVHYILPAIVPLALLVAIAIDAARERAITVVRVTAGAAILGGVGGVVAFVAGLHVRGDFAEFSHQVMLRAGIGLVVWGLLTLVVARTHWRAIACAAAVCPFLAAVIFQPLTGYAEARSARALAEHVAGERVVSFDSFRTSLPFYLREPVPLAAPTARALTSRYILDKPIDTLRPYVVHVADLRAMLASEHPPLVVVNRSLVSRVRALSPRPLTVVYRDRVSVLLRETS